MKEFVSDIKVVEKNDHVLVLNTKKGMIAIEMRNTKAPLTTQAIENLAASHFYDGLTFHRVEDNFLIQTGDPYGGANKPTGKPKIPLEVNADLSNGIRGAVGMARPEDDPNGADTQFYILLMPKLSLDGKYAVFGQVVKGLEVADKIEQGDGIINAVVVSGLPELPEGTPPTPIPAPPSY